MHCMVARALERWGSAEHKRRLLPAIAAGELRAAFALTEPAAGSDLTALRTRAERQGDHYLVNGQKTFISNGILADIVVVAARTAATSTHGISLLVVERGMEGFERGSNMSKMGMKTQQQGQTQWAVVKMEDSIIEKEEEQVELTI